MKSHLNVSAKLELQTQERMYESRLLHLENGEKVVCIFYSTEILIMHNQNHDIVQPWREPRSTARTTTQPEMIMGDIDTNDDDFYV